MWKKTNDGSVIDATGKIIFFSTERFVKDICLGGCCFICGADRRDKPFNDEHVIPEWLLRRQGLFHQTIILPNQVGVRYDRYKVPCCVDCNALMGRVVEEPISEVFAGGLKGINDFAAKGGLLKLFVWMGLIFLKTHLKDRTHRQYLDARKGIERIADQYEWEYLHHIHTVTRCFYTGCYVAREVIGSFLTTPMIGTEGQEKFDFADLYLPQTMLLRVDDVGMLAVFNDSAGAMNYFRRKFERITGPLSALQLRETMVELAWLNVHLKERPVFRSDIDPVFERHRIVAELPQLDLAKLNFKVRGRLLHHAVRHALPSIRISGLTGKKAEAEIKSGRATFLFGDDGKFNAQSFVLMEHPGRAKKKVSRRPKSAERRRKKKA